MEKKQFINTLTPGAVVDGLFLLAAATQNTARNGPYWRIEFKDSSGSIESKIWSPLSLNFPDLKAGSIADVQGRVIVYRERNEIAVEAMRVLSDEEKAALNLSDYMPASARDGQSMLEELEQLCRKTFSHAAWKKFYKLVLKDEEIAAALPIAPAAKGMHHAYAGGLLEHTLGVCRAALNFADLYPQLDRQVLLAGALCHDLGKIRELSSDLVIDYTSAGRLMGHISIAIEMLEPFIRKSALEPELAEHLRHLVLSHHGIREYGSPILPATAEAMALHFADNLDAKMNQITGVLEAIDEEDGWSNYVPGLDRHIFKPKASPEPDGVRAKNTKTKQVSQCSLLLKE
ncbi:HD domain-containing protein [Desulfovibrio sp. OttesenSCG-928-F07]|nr:HD domain-containing protein [Desulfovibrio sp. OttesenSCG-928-F07]